MKKIKKIRIIDPGSPPDVDNDIMTEKRGDLIEYIINKYGSNNVASIAIPGPFKAKNAWKSMCTIHEVPFDEANKVSKLIPEEANSIFEILSKDGKWYNEGKEIRDYVKDNPILKHTLECASKLDGRMRETGVHPCGYIISSKPLTDTVPVIIREDGLPIIQYSYPDCESMGLLKMDLLGLDTIDLIHKAVDNVKLTENIDIDLGEIISGSLNDKKTFEMFKSGNTEAIFQFAGSGVQEMLKKVAPTEFEELSAITALYRPGPMGLNLHNDFADRKHNVNARIPVHKNFKGTEVEDLLEKTLSALVYQEQIILIAQRCAGFSAKKADSLRKAIGKKKMDLMLSLGDEFKKGMVENGYGEEEVNELWNGIVGFGQYCFNKSHSVSYALNSYQSAFLKANYPVEFMAALLKQKQNDKDIMKYIAELRRLNIRILPPNINNSTAEITPTIIEKKNKFGESLKEKVIVYGLHGIKKLNLKIAENIIEEREKNGKFKDISDFVLRCNEFITPNIIKILANSGTFDEFGTRKGISDISNEIYKRAKDRIARKDTIKCSLFDLAGLEESSDLMQIPTEEYDFLDKVKNEFESTNMFISSHPLDKFDSQTLDLEKISNTNTNGTNNYSFYGTFTKIEQGVKKGKRYINVTIDNKISKADFRLNHNDTVRIRKESIINSITDFVDEEDRIEKACQLSGYTEGKSKVSFKDLKPLPNPVVGNVYKFTVKVSHYNGNTYTGIVDFEEILIDKDGKIKNVYEIKLKNKDRLKAFEDALKENLGNDEVTLVFPDGERFVITGITFYSGATQNTLENLDR